MTIELIRVCGAAEPLPDEGVTLIYLTNPAIDCAHIEVHHGQGGFHSVAVIRAVHATELAAVLPDYLTSLDFDSANDLTVAIYSDNRTVNAYDAAYIARIGMPEARMETPDGEPIAGFKTRVSPIIESDFEFGAIAALDGQQAEANPYTFGTEAHDKWASGFQSGRAEGVQIAS